MAFGLVSVLVTLGIIMLVMSMMMDQKTGSLTAGIAARQEAQQIAGVGKDGEAATQSADLKSVTGSGGKLDRLLVRQVVPGGAYDTYFGLQKDDEIIKINGMKVNDISLGDSALAKALVSDAYQRQQPITVIRQGQQVDLPLAAAAPAPVAPAPAPAVVAAAPTTAPAPAAPAPAAKQESRNPYRRQIEAIKESVN